MANERERPALGAEDARFVERVAALYAPEPPTEARRAAFDAQLRGRLRARRRAAWLGPALAATCAAALLAWAGVALWTPADAPGTSTLVAQRPAASAWERRLFYADVATGVRELEGVAEELPADYLAIESIFFDG